MFLSPPPVGRAPPPPRALPQALRADREVVVTAIRQDARAFAFASADLRADRDIVRMAVCQDGDLISFAAGSLLGDADLMLAAARQDGALRATGTRSGRPRMCSPYIAQSILATPSFTPQTTSRAPPQRGTNNISMPLLRSRAPSSSWGPCLGRFCRGLIMMGSQLSARSPEGCRPRVGRNRPRRARI